MNNRENLDSWFQNSRFIHSNHFSNPQSWSDFSLKHLEDFLSVNRFCGQAKNIFVNLGVIYCSFLNCKFSCCVKFEHVVNRPTVCSRCFPCNLESKSSCYVICTWSSYILLRLRRKGRCISRSLRTCIKFDSLYRTVIIVLLKKNCQFYMN